VTEAPLSRAELIAQLPGFEVLIVRLAHQIDREVIDAGHRLKAIVTATTGLDHIDMAYAQSQGIAVLSLRGETEFLRAISATAEHTWALLLALLRRIPQAATSVQAGEWERDAFKGHELDGQRLGIIGLGRIGCKVARYGLAFGMRVAAFDPFAVEWIDGVARGVTLADVLRRSDVLALHVPLNAETTRLIGATELAQLPHGAVVINTARGEVIDEEALVRALERGQLAGAALDVIAHEREPQLRTDGLLLHYARRHDNLLITPHIGGTTYESMSKTEVFMARKLAAYLNTVDVA
jgi:D-3-phosphoglycerate dehydrogenase / 2-oxoglutarate reductase